jgi:hypothetical protein
MYVIINAAIGGSGGGTPNPSTFRQSQSGTSALLATTLEHMRGVWRR